MLPTSVVVVLNSFFFKTIVFHHLSLVDTLNYTSCENEHFLTQASFYME